MNGHAEQHTQRTTQWWRTPVAGTGSLVYGFHEPKGIAPLPTFGRTSVKGEPHLGGQESRSAHRPCICALPAIKSSLKTGDPLSRIRHYDGQRLLCLNLRESEKESPVERSSQELLLKAITQPTTVLTTTTVIPTTT